MSVDGTVKLKCYIKILSKKYYTTYALEEQNRTRAGLSYILGLR